MNDAKILQNKNPLISVIIPVYNVEKYLQRCIDSITNQTFKNLEIILIDDGSPDSCPKLCDENAQKDSRIKVIHKRNGGLSSARNAGLEIATGEYISFIDSDDWVENDMYEKMLEIGTKTHFDFIMFGIKKQKPSGEYEILQFNKNDTPNLYLNKQDVLKLFCTLRENSFYAVELHAAVNKFFKSEFLNHKETPIRFDESNYGCEDGVFSTNCFDKASSVCVVNESPYNYFYNVSSICNKTEPPEKIKKKFECALNLKLQTYNFYKKNNLDLHGFLKYFSFSGVCDVLFFEKENNELKKYAESVATPLFLLRHFPKHKKDVIKIILYKLKLLNFFRKIGIINN